MQVSIFAALSIMKEISTTKEKIVDLSRELIQHIGYHSFNYKQVATQLDIKNAAVHHYYPAKEDLGLAVIEKDRADFALMTKSLESATPTEKTEAVLALYKQYFTTGKKLCLMSTCGLAYEDLPEKMRLASKNYLEEMIIWLTAAFKAGQQLGEFSFTGKPDDITAVWITALPGALISGRILGAGYMETALNNLRKLLNPA
jgi:TetR/AcrR family transcriptional repressor of nem operon